MRINKVKEQIDFLLNKLINNKDISYFVRDYERIANDYRINTVEPITDSNEVVLNVLESYPGSNIMMSIDEISEEFDDRMLTKSVLEYMSEWSYIYGSKGKSTDNMEVPNYFGDPTNKVDEIKINMNERVKSTDNLTPNDMALAIEIAGLICREYISEYTDADVFNYDTYIQVMNILGECESFIEMKRDGRLDWDMMGSTFREISKYIQADIMKNKGEESIIEDLQEFEGDSIEEYLDQIN